MNTLVGGRICVDALTNRTHASSYFNLTLYGKAVALEIARFSTQKASQLTAPHGPPHTYNS